MRQEELVGLSSGEMVVCCQCALSWHEAHKATHSLAHKGGPADSPNVEGL